MDDFPITGLSVFRLFVSGAENAGPAGRMRNVKPITRTFVIRRVSLPACACHRDERCVRLCVCVSKCACTLGSAAHEMQIDDDCQGFSCGFDELPAFSPLSLLEMLVNSNVLATLLPRFWMGVCAECVLGCVCVREWTCGLRLLASFHVFACGINL